MFENEKGTSRWEVLNMIKKHPLISTFVLILVAVGIFFAFRLTSQATPSSNKKEEKTNGAQEKKLPVEVAIVRKGAIGSSILTTATLDPDRQVTILSETNGIVGRITVEEGDYVQDGQTLVELDQREKRAKLQQAEVKLNNAVQELQRKLASYNAKIISEQEYEKAKYEKEAATAEVGVAKVDLDRTVIRAPFAGQITQRYIEKGQSINAQTQLLTIVDATPLEAKIYLPEREILGIKANQVAYLSLNSRKDILFQGAVRQINPAVDPKTGTVKVTVEVHRAPAEVRPGSFVDVKMETSRHDNALLIPKKALVEEAGERFVFVIQKGLAARRNVTTGFMDDQNAEILSGVSDGETVVISGQGSLRDGSKTEIIAQK